MSQLESMSLAEEEEESSPKDQGHRQHFAKFLEDLAKLETPEAKLQFAIEFMEASLSQTGTPHFKSFWEARSVSLQLFKEDVTPAVRTIYWEKYHELSKEARRLKEILDEQSSFAVEQIEIAIKALENEIDGFAEQVQKIPAIDIELTSQSLKHHIPQYQSLQRELNLLNTQAARINALRKELIRTEMRVRQKNRFFQRLSAAGDKVFPRRKDLIKAVSDQFILDVDLFIKNYFSTEHNESLFALREEIKALQNMAKQLTLNTHAFTQTRMRLSECWDKVKADEKERKKERTQQKATFKHNVETILGKLREFSTNYQEQQLSTAEATKQLDSIYAYARSLELGRDDQRMLRGEFDIARKPITDKLHAQEQARLEQEKEKDQQRRNAIQTVRQQIDALIEDNSALDADTITQQRNALIETISGLPIAKMEKQELERHMKPLRDIILEKKELSLLSLPESDREALTSLKEVLKQRKERRQEIKAQIDALKKLSGGASGLDFEQAMNYNSQIMTEKERLEKINNGIQEIEQKIADLAKH
jgi:hypothetical protein